MVISTKKVMILALLGLSCLGAYPIYQTLKKGQNAPKIAVLESFLEGKLVTGNKRFNEVLAQELEQEHAQLLNGIQKAFNIPDAQWKETLESFAEVKQEDTLLKGAELYIENPEEHESIRLAKSILARAGMNPDRVNVYVSNNPLIRTNAGAGQGYTKDGVAHELEINEANFSKKSLQDQMSIFKHEIRHLYYYDGLERALIMQCLKKQGIDTKTFKEHPAVQAYFKFQEYRADLTAAVESIETANQFKQFFKNVVDSNIYPEYTNGKSSASHPNDEERYAMVNRLVGYLEAEQINSGTLA